MATSLNFKQLGLAVTFGACVLAGCAHGDSQPERMSPMADSTNATSNPEATMVATSDSPQAMLGHAGDPQSIANQGQPIVDSAPIAVQPAPAAAQDDISAPPDSSGVNSAATSVSAEAALQRLHAFNAGEIPMARLARRAGGKAVARYGAEIVRDRQMAEAKISRAAGKLNVAVMPVTDDRAKSELQDDQETLSALRKVHGVDFDRLYARHMRQDRREAVEAATTLRTNCTDPKLCSLIDALLPSMQKELADAQALPMGGSPSASNP